MLGLFSKKPEPKSAAQLDQEAKDEAEIQASYQQSLKEQRIINAKAAGIAEANKKLNQKPFYQKRVGAASAIGKDLMATSSQVNPNALFSFDEPKQPRKRRKKRKR